MITTLRDRSRQFNLAAAARRRVQQRYDWQAIGARFVDLVEAAAREKSNPTT